MVESVNLTMHSLHPSVKYHRETMNMVVRERILEAALNLNALEEE